MSGVSVPTPNDVPRDVIALAGVFFIIALLLITAVELITSSRNLLFNVGVIGVLMAIWFGIVVYFVWSTD